MCVAKFIKDILLADFKKLSSQCQSIASKCAETDFSAIFYPDDISTHPNREMFNAYVHVYCKAANDLCGPNNTVMNREPRTESDYIEIDRNNITCFIKKYFLKKEIF